MSAFSLVFLVALAIGLGYILRASVAFPFAGVVLDLLGIVLLLTVLLLVIPLCSALGLLVCTFYASQFIPNHAKHKHNISLVGRLDFANLAMGEQRTQLRTSRRQHLKC